MKPPKPDAAADAKARQAEAYGDMEPHLNDAVRQSRIAMLLFDNPDSRLLLLAVDRLEKMLQDLRKNYYAESFLA